MSAQTEETSSLGDVVKLVFSPVLIVIGLIAFYQFPDILVFYRVLVLILIVLVAGAIVLSTVKGKSILRFVLESKHEFRRVVWPSKDEAVKTTLLVFAMVLLVGIILWFLDMFLFWAVQLLMGKGSS